jgi:hypothetical protein
MQRTRRNKGRHILCKEGAIKHEVQKSSLEIIHLKESGHHVEHHGAQDEVDCARPPVDRPTQRASLATEVVAQVEIV